MRVFNPYSLAARTSAELSGYLRSRGWQLTERRTTSATWTLPYEDDEFEVLQPLDPSVRDYAARMRDVLDVLAEAEGRSALDILYAMSNSSSDVHRVRIFPPD